MPKIIHPEDIELFNELAAKLYNMPPAIALSARKKPFTPNYIRIRAQALNDKVTMNGYPIKEYLDATDHKEQKRMADILAERILKEQNK